MRYKIKFMLFIFLISSICMAANERISQLPLGVSGTVGTLDSFPYVENATSTTKRLKLSDLPTTPAFIATLANYITIAGGLQRTVNTVSSLFTVPTLTKDYILNVNTTSGVVSAILPDAIASSGFCIDIKNTGSPASNVSVTAYASQLIDGVSTDLITGAEDAKHYCAVSGSWFIY